MWLTRLSIHRPLIIWMALVAIGVLGVLSYRRLPAELNPRVDIPTLTITTIYPGAGPREVETQIAQPLETAVGSVSRLKSVYASCQDSLSVLSLDFEIGTDLNQALSDVREKVESARYLLPAEARSPIVAKLDINAQPVLYLGIAASGSISDLREWVDLKLKPEISRVPGVASVAVEGGRKREAQVLVDNIRLSQLNLSITDVVHAIEAANVNLPAGTITTGDRQIGVRMVGAFDNLIQIGSAQILVPPRAGVSNAPLFVRDVATVREGYAEEETRNRVNGRPSVGILIAKTSDANAVAVADGVKEVLASKRAEIPGHGEVFFSRDESVTVRDALEDVDFSMLLGAFLAMLVVFLFLGNFRGAVIISLALPACMLATFVALHIAHFTLNQMSLLALSLSVGILIDDSIVVLESITRHFGMGKDPKDAALDGRAEIGFADLTTTLVDVVVYIPIAFMGGIIGSFFREFGLTVAFATLFSLIVSFSVTPALAARWYRRGESVEPARSGLLGIWERGYLFVERIYRRTIARVMRSRGWTIAWVGVVLTSVIVVCVPRLGTDLLPSADQGQVTIAVECPPDVSIEYTDRIIRSLEAKVSADPDVMTVAATVGEIPGGFGAIPQRGPRFGQISARLREKASALGGSGKRNRPDSQVADSIRRSLSGVKGARITVATLRGTASPGPPLQVNLRGQSLEALISAANQIRDRISEIPGVFDADVSVRPGRRELRATIDRFRAASLGVPPAEAGLALRSALEGSANSVLREGGSEVPIRVHLNAQDRQRPDGAGRLIVARGPQGPVRLEQIATLTFGAGPSSIERKNGQRSVTISANLTSSTPLGDAQQSITDRMESIPMEGISFEFSGEGEAMNENMGFFAAALALAVLLVYLLMVSLFNSLTTPLVIMFTLPMAAAGALGALVLCGEALSLVSMIGIIMLIGLMGRNAILLIDYANTLRSRGVARDEAIVEAGRVRLRPILMTTLATIAGMTPIAMRLGRASEMRAPMAITVIGGLVVSTILTLVVIPAVYSVMDDLQNRVYRNRRFRSASMDDTL